jgi:hypothetical protein
MLRCTSRVLGLRFRAALLAPKYDFSGQTLGNKSIAQLRDDLDRAQLAAANQDLMVAKRAVEIEAQLCIKLTSTGREKDTEEAITRAQRMWEDYLSPSVSKKKKILHGPSALWSMRLTMCNLMSRVCARHGKTEESIIWKKRLSEKKVLNKTILEDFFENESPEALAKRIAEMDSSSRRAMSHDADDDDPNDDDDPLRMAATQATKASEEKKKDGDTTDSDDNDEKKVSAEEFFDSMFRLKHGSPMEKYKYESYKSHPAVEKLFGIPKQPGPRQT